MKFFFDTEFIDNGKTIELISIGIVNELGDTFYRVSSEFSILTVKSDPWLCKHVWPYVEEDANNGASSTKEEIAEDLIRFVGGYDYIEFWAYFGAYDFVVLRQLFGRGIDGPKFLPFYYNEIQAYAKQNNVRIKHILKESLRHHALNDAMEVKLMYDRIRTEVESRGIQIDY